MLISFLLTLSFLLVMLQALEIAVFLMDCVKNWSRSHHPQFHHPIKMQWKVQEMKQHTIFSKESKIKKYPDSVLYITIKQNFSEHVWTYSCVSSISKKLTAVIQCDTATTCVTSGILCNVHESCAVLGYYILLVPTSRTNNATEPWRWDWGAVLKYW